METGAVEIKVPVKLVDEPSSPYFDAYLGIDPVGTFVGGRGTRVQAE